MSEDVLEQKLEKIRQIGKDYAKAKSELARLEHGRKILISVLMKEYMISSNTGKLESAVSQEREARADERYKKHIDKLAEAVRKEAELSWEKFTIQMNFEKWKTEMISQIREYKNYGGK